MLFSTSIFLYLFLPVLLIMYYVIARKNSKLKNTILLIVSLFFYSWGEPKFIFIMLLSIIINWLFGILVDKYKKDKFIKGLIAINLFINLFILFIFKYLMFTINNINSIFEIDITVPNIILPIGISFFTFQAISYVVDVYRQNGKVQKNPLNVALYISFFPQLIAGPIVRYETIADQIENRVETLELFIDGIKRFILGLAKKMLIANNMALIADSVFVLGNNELNTYLAWFGAVAYTLQIYYDFSGYSDMAIGLGKMFGFEFLENFNYPYISKSISEFWRRWHISLGSWFRDYVYIPLGGSKVSKKRLVLNLFVVWILTGIWHGANWTYIVWGMMYFILIVIEKLYNIEKIKINKIFRHLYTIFFVIIGWVIFRSENIINACIYLKNMFNFNFIMESYNIINIKNSIIIILAIILSTNIFGKINKKNNIYKVCEVCIYLIIFIISASYIVKNNYNPFIYFNF